MKPCDMGVGCDEAGVCFAEAQGQPDRCTRRPEVLNKHKSGVPAGAVYVGRGSPWGNPFVMRDFSGTERDRVCDRFETETLPTLDLAPLRGKDLVCFCAPKRCHADALLREANK